MGLFNRKQTNSVLPELDQYYDGQKRDKASLAWLLAAVSVAIVVLFFVVLFLASRWAYREFTGANDSTNDSNQIADSGNSDTEDETLSFDGKSADGIITDNGEDSSNNTDSVTNPPDDTESSDNSINDQPAASGDVEIEGTVDAPARTNTPSTPNTPQVPITGDNEALPGTGAEGVLALFVAVSILAGGTHYILSTKNSRL